MPDNTENPFEGLERMIKLGRAFLEGGAGQDIWSHVTDSVRKPAADTPADAAAAREKLLFSELSKISEALGDLLLELKALRQAVSKPVRDSRLNLIGDHGPRVEPGSDPLWRPSD